MTDRYKLVHFYLPDVDEWELFDLKTDPHELKSVFGDATYVPVVAELKRTLDQLRAEVKEPAETPKDAYGTLYAPCRPAARKAATVRP